MKHIKKYLLIYLILLFLVFTLIFKYLPTSFDSWITATVNSATIVSFIFIWILNGKVESLKEKYNEIKDKVRLDMLAEEEHLEGINIAKNYLEILKNNNSKLSEIEETHQLMKGHFKDFYMTYDNTIKEELRFSIEILKKVNINRMIIDEKVRKSSISNMRDILRLLDKNRKLKSLDSNKLREKTEEALINEE